MLETEMEKGNGFKMNLDKTSQSGIMLGSS
jgi:hypothetical protein